MLVLEILGVCALAWAAQRLSDRKVDDRAVREAERRARRAELAELPRREEVDDAVIAYGQAVARRVADAVDPQHVQAQFAASVMSRECFRLIHGDGALVVPFRPHGDAA